MLGKTLKYLCWGSFAIFMYHLYLVTYKSKPEEYFGVSEKFLYAAMQTRFAYEDLYALLTRPPVNSLLMERPPLPPGYQNMKTLVLNITGVLVHSEYKVRLYLCWLYLVGNWLWDSQTTWTICLYEQNVKELRGRTIRRPGLGLRPWDSWCTWSWRIIHCGKTWKRVNDSKKWSLL